MYLCVRVSVRVRYVDSFVNITMVGSLRGYSACSKVAAKAASMLTWAQYLPPNALSHNFRTKSIPPGGRVR